MQYNEFDYHKFKLSKCIRYRDLDSAIFISLHLSYNDPSYTLLSAILLYEKGEHARSNFLLGNSNGTTATYYKALNFKERKEYDAALACINSIINITTWDETYDNMHLRSYLISVNDSEHFYSLAGELLTLKGKCGFALESYKKSFFISPLLGPCMALYDENYFFPPVNDYGRDCILNLYRDLFEIHIFTAEKVKASHIPKSFKDAMKIFKQFQYHAEMVPGTGSYFLSKMAANLCKITGNSAGAEIFEYIRATDPFFINDLDSYSTYLWVESQNTLLGHLAKSLIQISHKSYITWSVIANYFAINGKMKESTICLMKSLSLKENHYTYSLLGFDFNSRNQYLEAQAYFKSSLAMHENNDRAYFGLGYSLSETFNKTKAETYFNKALSINSLSLNMKALVIKFYVKNLEIDKALSKVKEYLKLNYQTLDEIADAVVAKAGHFNDTEELIICELSEIFLKKSRRDLAARVIDYVKCRKTTYYAKKNLIEKDE